jgi:hypothetical protein
MAARFADADSAPEGGGEGRAEQADALTGLRIGAYNLAVPR